MSQNRAFPRMISAFWSLMYLPELVNCGRGTVLSDAIFGPRGGGFWASAVWAPATKSSTAAEKYGATSVPGLIEDPPVVELPIQHTSLETLGRVASRRFTLNFTFLTSRLHLRTVLDHGGSHGVQEKHGVHGKT